MSGLNKTLIEWVKNPPWKWTDSTGAIHIEGGEQGFTWNPITGCLNHDNGLCKGGGFPCYAYKLAHGRLRQRYLANTHLASHIPEDIKILPTDPFYPRFWQSRLDEPLYGNPKGIFVCDMGELFGDWLPEGWVNEVFHTINRSPQHCFYLLTKQPQNLPKWSPFPDNCWVGVTATNYAMFVDACGYLGALKHEGKIKTAFVSIEPLLSWESTEAGGFILSWLMMGDIDQVIIGAQTKPYKPPKIEWVEEIVRATDQAGIPVFLKNNLMPLISCSTGKNLTTLTVKQIVDAQTLPRQQGEYKLRQEMPVI